MGVLNPLFVRRQSTVRDLSSGVRPESIEGRMNTSAHNQRSDGLGPRARGAIALSPLVAALVLSLTLLAALGCYNNNTGETNIAGDIRFTLPAFPETGSNKVQVFTEMHYQPSYRAQEGPRLLSPDGAVPISGAEVVLTSVDEYKALPNPGGDPNAGATLFGKNCIVCHGASLQGDGAITKFPTTVVPANLKEELTVNRTDGELFGLISFGGNTGLTVRIAAMKNPAANPDQCVIQGTCPMPEFRKLLTADERWDLVAYLRNQQGR